MYLRRLGHLCVALQWCDKHTISQRGCHYPWLLLQLGWLLQLCGVLQHWGICSSLPGTGNHPWLICNLTSTKTAWTHTCGIQWGELHHRKGRSWSPASVALDIVPRWIACLRLNVQQMPLIGNPDSCYTGQYTQKSCLSKAQREPDAEDPYTSCKPLQILHLAVASSHCQVHTVSLYTVGSGLSSGNSLQIQPSHHLSSGCRNKEFFSS